MMNTEAKIARFRDEYLSQQNNLERFTHTLENCIVSILKLNQLPFHLVESRTKSLESAEKKLWLDRDKYPNPIADLKDLSGIRIVVHDQDTVNKIRQLLQESFTSFDEQKAYKGFFEYKSLHLYLTLDQGRQSLPEWKGLSGLKAEVQIRTILQHAWATLSHEFSYKRSNESISSEASRMLDYLSGALSDIDKKITDIYKQENKIESEFSISSQSELNNKQIECYLLESEHLSSLQQKLIDKGWKKPIAQAKSLSSFSASTFKELGIGTIAQLDSTLLHPTEACLRFMELIQINCANKNENLWANKIDILLLCLIYNLKDYIRNQLGEAFIDGIGWKNPIFIEAIKQQIISNNGEN